MAELHRAPDKDAPRRETAAGPFPRPPPAPRPLIFPLPPPSAMVELHRALDENAVCRSPLLDGHQSRAELRDLYKLHLLNTPVPHSFATLLQVGPGGQGRAGEGRGGDGGAAARAARHLDRDACDRGG
jgi:hypothetical protein